MKRLNEEYVEKYEFKQYISTNHVNEDLGDLLGKFWNWLVGGDDDTNDEFVIGDNNYDEGLKKKHINKYDDKSVSTQVTNNVKVINELIKNQRPADDTKSVFDKTKTYLDQLDGVTKDLYYNTWVFKSDGLNEIFAIQVFKKSSDIDEEAIELPVFDTNPLYKKFITPVSVRNSIVELCKTYKKNKAIIINYDKAIIKGMIESLKEDIVEDKPNKCWIFTVTNKNSLSEAK